MLNNLEYIILEQSIQIDKMQQMLNEHQLGVGHVGILWIII